MRRKSTLILAIVVFSMISALAGCSSAPPAEPAPASPPPAPTGTAEPSAPSVTETAPPEASPDTSAAPAPAPAPVPAETPEAPASPLASLGLVDEPANEAKLDVALVYSGGEAAGFCYLGSYAMLAKYADPGITFTDVIANSGVATSAVYMAPMNLLMNEFSIGSMGVAAGNQGFDYYLAALKGAQLTDEFFAADLVTDARQPLAMDSGEEAFELLKKLISSDIPVMVHLDISYLKDELSSQSSYLGDVFRFSGPGDVDHYMVVTGYNQDTIYLNDPTEPAPGKGKDIQVAVSGFMSAWENGNSPSLNEDARIGPYWMLFLGERGPARSAAELIAWNKEIGRGAPAAIRQAAERPNINDVMHCNEMYRARKEYGTFLKQNGHASAGDMFLEAAELFGKLCQSSSQQADLLKIADLQEQALAQ